MTFVPLSSRDDISLPPDAYDVRGWNVHTRRDDVHVGTVDDMLLDGEGWPRYLAVHAESGGRRVLVPLDRATAEPGKKRVYVRALTAERFHTLPSWAGDVERLGGDYETRLLDEWDRAERDDVAAPERRSPSSSLARLSDLEEYDVADGSTDIRGWTVVLGDGKKLGTVGELLFDRNELRVRYVDCDVYEDKLELERIDRHLLLPVEHVRIEQKDKHVLVDGLFSQDVADYPVYGGLPLAADAEERIAERFRSRRGPSPERPAPGGRDFFAGAGTPPSAPGDGSEDGITVHEGGDEGDAVVVRKGDREVRIRISGDDILIEKGRRSSPGPSDHG